MSVNAIQPERRQPGPGNYTRAIQPADGGVAGRKNAAVQIPTEEQFLPVMPPANHDAKSSTDYIYEPGKEFIVKDLIPRSLKTQFYKALLDSVASEHGARMTAMHKATDNAKDMLRDLKISYNKARQASITNEILEIVGGAEALNG